MNLPNSPIQNVDVSRRQLLATTGTVIAGASTLAWAGTDRAAAAVSAGEISVPPTQVETPDGEVEAVDATVTGSYQYATNGADAVRFELRVAPPDGQFGTIDTVEQTVSTATGSGQYTLSGSVLDHDAIDAGTFAVDPEQTRTLTLPIRVEFAAMQGGEAVVEAMAEGAADVTVESGEIVASAAVLGEGEVAVKV